MIRIRQLPHAKGLPLPTFATEGSAGCDLCAACPDFAPVIVQPGCTVVVETGLVMAIPEGYEGQIRSRSGLAKKEGLIVLNSPGTIDSDYRGEIKLLIHNVSYFPRCIERGDRIAQLVVAKVWHFDFVLDDRLCVDETKRGGGGFGSTGV